MIWDLRFLALADHIASWSKDPSTKVGAVIVRKDRTVASLGYNGLPRGVRDLPERLYHREFKYPMTVHAELNAILASREPLRGMTIYVSPFSPCASCAAAIIQVGITDVVYRASLETLPNWGESTRLSFLMLREAGVFTKAVE